MPIVMCNMPALLLRKKTKQYPEGRTSYRFKKELRNKITIIGKTAFKDPNAPVTFSEADLPETAEEERKMNRMGPKAHQLNGDGTGRGRGEGKSNDPYGGNSMGGPPPGEGKGRGKGKGKGKGKGRGKGGQAQNYDFLN